MPEGADVDMDNEEEDEKDDQGEKKEGDVIGASSDERSNEGGDKYKIVGNHEEGDP